MRGLDHKAIGSEVFPYTPTYQIRQICVKYYDVIAGEKSKKIQKTNVFLP